MSKDDDLPEDYEACGECGFDHSYEPIAAARAHDKELENLTTHVKILVTGCGYDACTANDFRYEGLHKGEILIWHPVTGHAYVVCLERVTWGDK